MACSENCGSHPHQGGAFFYGRFKITGHAHGQLIHEYSGDIRLPDLLSKMAKGFEKGPGSLAGRQNRGAWSSAPDGNMGKLTDRRYQFKGLGFMDTALGFFFADIDLNEDVLNFVYFSGTFVQLPGQLEGIHRMDQVKDPYRIFGLIGLEVADIMPLYGAVVQGP